MDRNTYVNDVYSFRGANYNTFNYPAIGSSIVKVKNDLLSQVTRRLTVKNWIEESRKMWLLDQHFQNHLLIKQGEEIPLLPFNQHRNNWYKDIHMVNCIRIKSGDQYLGLRKSMGTPWSSGILYFGFCDEPYLIELRTYNSSDRNNEEYSLHIYQDTIEYSAVLTEKLGHSWFGRDKFLRAVPFAGEMTERFTFHQGDYISAGSSNTSSQLLTNSPSSFTTSSISSPSNLLTSSNNLSKSSTLSNDLSTLLASSNNLSTLSASSNNSYTYIKSITNGCFLQSDLPYYWAKCESKLPGRWEKMKIIPVA